MTYFGRKYKAQRQNFWVPPFASAAELERLNTRNIFDGVSTFLQSNRKSYTFNRGSKAVPDGVNVIQPDRGPGRWLVDTYPGVDSRIIAGDWPTLDAAVAANPGKTIVINSAINVDADLLDATVGLEFEMGGNAILTASRTVDCYLDMSSGGKWTIPAGDTLTFGIQAYPNAPEWLQIFDWDVDSYDDPPVSFERLQFGPVFTRWFGGNAAFSSDITKQIQAAINSIPPATQSKNRSVGRVVINGGGLISEITHVQPGAQPNITNVGLLLNYQQIVLEGLGTSDSGVGPGQTLATLLEWAGSEGMSMIQVRGCTNSTIRNMRLRGDPDNKPAVALDLHQPQGASESFKGNRYVRFDTISIGEGGGAHEFVSGIEGTSPGGGNDFHEFHRIEINNCDNGIRNDNGNHTFWNFHNCRINNCTNAYSMGAGSGRTYFYQLHCSLNTWDFNWESSSDQTPRVVFVEGYGSEGSVGMANLNGWCRLHIRNGGFSARGTSPTLIEGTGQARFQLVELDNFQLADWASDPLVGSVQVNFPSVPNQKRFFQITGRLGPSIVVHVDAQTFPISGPNNWIRKRFEIEFDGDTTQVTEWSL